MFKSKLTKSLLLEKLNISKSKDAEIMMVKADVEKECFFQCEVNLKDVPTQSSPRNEKIEERYS